jgi:hypothetical protein
MNQQIEHYVLGEERMVLQVERTGKTIEGERYVKGGICGR